MPRWEPGCAATPKAAWSWMTSWSIPTHFAAACATATKCCASAAARSPRSMPSRMCWAFFPRVGACRMTYRHRGETYDVFVRLRGVHASGELAELAAGEKQKPDPGEPKDERDAGSRQADARRCSRRTGAKGRSPHGEPAPCRKSSSSTTSRNAISSTTTSTRCTATGFGTRWCLAASMLRWPALGRSQV